MMQKNLLNEIHKLLKKTSEKFPEKSKAPKLSD